MHGVITHEFTFFPKPNCDSSCFPIVCAVCWYKLDTVVTTPLYLFRLKKKKQPTKKTKNKRKRKQNNWIVWIVKLLYERNISVCL